LKPSGTAGNAADPLAAAAAAAEVGSAPSALTATGLSPLLGPCPAAAAAALSPAAAEGAFPCPEDGRCFCCCLGPTFGAAAELPGCCCCCCWWWSASSGGGGAPSRCHLCLRIVMVSLSPSSYRTVCLRSSLSYDCVGEWGGGGEKGDQWDWWVGWGGGGGAHKPCGWEDKHVHCQLNV
jgi:hypothetical protein